jgi:quercetin dioxygenase-like cupin family protein
MKQPICANLRAVVHLALVSAGLVAMVVSGAAQARGGGQRGAAPGGARGGGISNMMTGTTSFLETTEMRMSRIRFEAGARTRWHVHSTGQLLLIEEGKGRLQEQGSAFQELTVGQPVYTKPNVRHWHGAAPGEAAVQFSVYSGTLEWQDEVTDEQYLGKSSR